MLKEWHDFSCVLMADFGFLSKQSLIASNLVNKLSLSIYSCILYMDGTQCLNLLATTKTEN